MNVRTEDNCSGKTQGSAVRLHLSKLQKIVFGSYTVQHNTSVLMFRRNLMRPSSGWLKAIYTRELNSTVLEIYDYCPESIKPFWISRELVAWPWCNLAASQRRPYCACVNGHALVGLVSRQWDTVEWTCVLCDCRIHNDRASRSASSPQCACTFYSSRACFFRKASHHPGLSAPPTAQICLPATSGFSQS